MIVGAAYVWGGDKQSEGGRCRQPAGHGVLQIACYRHEILRLLGE